MENHGHNEKHEHYILPYRMVFTIGGCLLLLTITTVAVAHIDLGRLNLVIALLIASIKASLVALFFMNLRYDTRENGMIFSTSFIFLMIFLGLTSTDLFFRGNVYVKGPLVPVAQAESHLVKPWISTSQLVSRGKTVFAQNCTPCHGNEGKGDGPAAAALNPHPRDFTSAAGWVNGRKPSQVFKTLKEGVPGSAMPSFASLPLDDRWAVDHYILSLGPTPPTDSPTDLMKVGIDPNKAGGGAEAQTPTLPIDFAMDRMTQPENSAEKNAHGFQPRVELARMGHVDSVGARLYRSRCVRCHAAKGQGGLKVRNLGVFPKAFVVTQAFMSHSDALRSEESFSRKVSSGLPGDLMPENGELSTDQMRALYEYVKGLVR